MPEPEIFLPAGTELTLALTSSMRVLPVDPSQQPLDPSGFSEDERAELDPIVSALPFRTQGAGGRPSDPVNLLLIGSRSEVADAFKAVGWTKALPKTVRSRLSVITAVVRGDAFANAPMAPLRLNDELADMSWEKGFNNFAKRHHLRLWKQGETTDGQEIWAVAATHDMDFARDVADRVVFLDQGRVAVEGSAELVFDERPTAALRAFLATEREVGERGA